MCPPNVVSYGKGFRVLVQCTTGGAPQQTVKRPPAHVRNEPARCLMKMNKRTFLKTTASLAASGLLAPLSRAHPFLIRRRGPAGENWAGNLEYSAENFYQAQSVADVQEVVRQSGKVRVLGTRHCFNRIADSEYNMVSIRDLDKIVDIDEEASTATIEAGASYGQICRDLHEQGYALHNLASLPHISVAGACATATHGSGRANGNLATQVSAIEFVDADGDLVTLAREKDGDAFAGAVVNLGGLGVVTRLRLDLLPTFQARQHVYLDLPVSALREHFEEIMTSGYSVSLFTDYQSDRVNQVWVKSKVEESRAEAEPDFYGATPADRNVHPILSASAENCTDQLGEPGPWYNRLPHFKMGFTPSSGKELQAEYFVPLEHAVDAYFAISELKEQITPYLMISEIRTIDADNLWMSTCHDGPRTAFHFTWEQDTEGVTGVLPLLEEALEPFGARPHWGKVFTMTPDRLQSLYPRLADFKELLAEYDPEGKFRNDYLQRHLYT